jgi:hypothetical protein
LSAVLFSVFFILCFNPTGDNTYNLRMSNNFSNKLLHAVFLSDSSQNTARNNLFDKLFCQITFGDILLTSHQIKTVMSGFK